MGADKICANSRDPVVLQEIDERVRQLQPQTSLFQQMTEKPGDMHKAIRVLSGWGELAFTLNDFSSGARVCKGLQKGAKIAEDAFALPDFFRGIGEIFEVSSSLAAGKGSRGERLADGVKLSEKVLSTANKAMKATNFFFAAAKEARPIGSAVTEPLGFVASVFELTGSGLGIGKLINNWSDIRARESRGERVTNEEKEVHSCKVHENWMGIVRQVGSLVMSILGVVTLVAGIVFAAPVALAIGTVMLVFSVAKTILSAHRESKEIDCKVQEILSLARTCPTVETVTEHPALLDKS